MDIKNSIKSSDYTNTKIANIHGTIYYKTNVGESISKQSANFELPPENDKFVGRQNDLERLYHLFFKEKQKMVVISGMPGIGKSELAKMFGWKCIRKKKCKVLWISLEKVKNYEHLSNCVISKCKQLKSKFPIINKHVLCIFDGAWKRQDIAFMEQKKYIRRILITSCKQDWHDTICSIKLEPLDIKSTLEIFKSILGKYYNLEHSEYYEKLGGFFNNVPLILHIIAEYTRTCKMRLCSNFNYKEHFQGITKSLDEHLNQTLPDNTSDTYGKSFHKAILVLITKMKQSNIYCKDLTFKLLYTCAFLHPNRIVIKDLLSMLSEKKSLLLFALGELNDIALINYTTESEFIKILNVIQNAVHYYMKEEGDYITQSKCYKKCLEFTVRENELKLLHISTLLQHADTYLTTFYEFYEKNEENMSKDIKLDVLNVFQIVNFIRGNVNFKEESFSSEKNFLQIILEILASTGCKISLKKLFDDFGEETTTKYINEYNLLHYSIKNKNLDVLKLLLEYDGVDVNKKNENLNTPSHMAAIYWNSDAYNYLISINANQTLKNTEKLTPGMLLLASGFNNYNNNCDVINKLLPSTNC